MSNPRTCVSYEKLSNYSRKIAILRIRPNGPCWTPSSPALDRNMLRRRFAFITRPQEYIYSRSQRSPPRHSESTILSNSVVGLPPVV